MIKKLLLASLCFGGLFATSCKKAADISSSPLQNENQRISNPEPQPTPVLSPTVFFIDQDTIWTVTDIAALNPIVSKKSSILNITPFGPLHENVFNFLPKFPNQTPNIIYNPLIDRILSTDGNKLYKCYTGSRNTTSTTLPNSIFAIPLRMNINQNQKLYYFSIVSIGKNQLRSINMDGTGGLVVRDFFGFQGSQLNESFVGDINFTNNKVYMKDVIHNSIAITDLYESFSALTPFVSAKNNESLKNSKIVYDDLNKQVFFSAKDTLLNKVRIYKINSSGDMNTLQMIIQANYTDKNHSFTFDISPETNTLFWCKREFNAITKKHTSVLTRTNLIGGNPKLLRAGNFINTVVVAKPVVNNG